MKKQILFAATALMLTAGIVSKANVSVAKASKKIAINKKNFPDQVFRELVRINYDKNKDKKLSKTEIKKAKRFGTSKTYNSIEIKKSKYSKYVHKDISDIKNFKGIEKLTNLQKFVANGTSVKTINLKKNKNLTYLKMQDGMLCKIDLNSNKKLKYVYLPYNKLTSLKMNKCKKLIKVNITGHMIKKVKIYRNKKTEIYGEDYYTPYSVTKIKEKFSNLNTGGQIDGDGTFCVYQWAADYSSCIRKTVNQTSMISQPVVLGSDALARAKSMQKITAQWKDAKGNFYFLADRDGNMAAKTSCYLIKVNAQGKIESELVVNDQLIPSMIGDMSDYNYKMTLLSVKNNIAALGMISFDMENGVVYVDLDKMVITKQAKCSFIPTAAEGDIIVGVESEYPDANDVVVSKMAPYGMTKAADGKTYVQTCLLSDDHMLKMPDRYEEYEEYGSAVQIYGQNIYVISGEGFFKAKLSANKFTQLYGISNFDGMQQPDGVFYLCMKGEKEIYLMSELESDDFSDTKTYQLQVGKIG